MEPKIDNVTIKIKIKETHLNIKYDIYAMFLVLFFRKKISTSLVWDLMTPPPPPLGVENVKIRENSEKIRGPSTTLYRALGADCLKGECVRFG